jgi:phytoene desaturase
MKSRKIDNLFFTGQLTVPGPGIPPAIISGQIAASEVLKQYA